MSKVTFHFRDVVKYVPVQSLTIRKNKGWYDLTLECGHHTLARRSKGVPLRKACRECNLKLKGWKDAVHEKTD